MTKLRKERLGRRTFVTDKATLFDDGIDAELSWAGDRRSIAEGNAALKKNYAEALSRALSQRFADALRDSFEGILPNESGAGQESKARTGKGLKKLDVNYSTVELGLGLGVSIKTINFRDAATKRYTKNYTRVDNELRAEAADYHERQPYSVLCAVVFLPLDSCTDGGAAPSSFGQAVQIFRYRAGREKPVDDSTLFEKILIGLYEAEGPSFGRVTFFDVMEPPPRKGLPQAPLTFRDAIQAIVAAYDQRNKSTFVWADGAAEVLEAPEITGEDDDS
jgi:hypothetical protein